MTAASWKFEVYKGEDGDWRWRLVQLEVLIVVESLRGFRRRSDAEDAAQAARDEIGTAPIAAL